MNRSVKTQLIVCSQHTGRQTWTASTMGANSIMQPGREVDWRLITFGHGTA